MKKFRNTVAAVAALYLTIMGAPSLRAEDGKSEVPRAESARAEAVPASPGEVSSRLQELQDEMDRIQGEMTNLKKQLGVSAATVSHTASTTQAAQTESTPATPTAPAMPAPAAPAAPADQPSALATALGPINVTGFVDGYYSYNFNHPRQTGGTPAAVVPGLAGPFLSTYRTFDGPANQFSLNMIELTVAKAPDPAASRLGYNLTFGFGNAENVVNSTEPGGLGFAQYLKEGYISYLAPVGRGLQIDFGKFVTPHGAEVIETKDNWNYSRGLLFNYAIPFYHFGLRAKYAFSDKFWVTGDVINGWNNIVDNNTGKTYGASFGWTPSKKVSIVQNYMAGPETFQDNSHWRQLSDTVVTYTATSKLSLMANYDYGRGDLPQTATRVVMWTGVAGYIRYAFNDRYALATRYEYFDDRNGFNTGTPQHFNEFTGTFERIVAKHLITRWEYRRDMSNRLTFAKGGTFTDHQDTLSGGLVYVFDVKDLK
jgi:hypothetical protein